MSNLVRPFRSKRGLSQQRLAEETDYKISQNEVNEAIRDVDERLLYKELIDVANICMMICENLATRPHPRAGI